MNQPKASGSGQRSLPLLRSTQIAAPPQVSIPITRYRDCDGYVVGNENWSPANSTGSGTFNLYTGTQQSVNTFYAQLELRTGLCQPVKVARSMGVTVPEDQIYPPFTLGIVNTYGALMLTYPTFLLPFATWVLIGYFRSIPVDSAQ